MSRAGPAFDASEDPQRAVLAGDERPDLIGLKLADRVVLGHKVVELPRGLRSSFEPTGDGVPGDALDPGDCGLADFVRAHEGDFVEGLSSALETIVGGSDSRAEGLAASGAAVPATSPAFEQDEALSDNVAPAHLPVHLTVGVG